MQDTSSPWSNNYVPLSTPQHNVFNSTDGMNHGMMPAQVSPLSTAMYSTTSTFSWAHTVPSPMPWMTRGEVASASEPVVHFTAPFPPDPCTSQTATSWELLNNYGPNKSNVNLHLKRKSYPDGLNIAPQKICVTEERMAARFREMHISNQYSVPSDNSSYGNSSDCNVLEVDNLEDVDAIMKSSHLESLSSSKSLVLAPELKKLVEPEKIFASTFLNKVERPTMALVLWQPKDKLMGKNSSSTENETQDDSPAQLNSFSPQLLSTLCTQGPLSNLNLNTVKIPSSFDDEMDT